MKLAGRYEIGTPLGQGGMGTVFEAFDTVTRNSVAIKALPFPKDAAVREKAYRQFQLEGGMLTLLDHPGLVRVLDTLEDEKHCYLVMELIRGATLMRLLEDRDGPMDVSDSLLISVQVAAVLAYLHEHDPPVSFRDLKPSNIMVENGGRIVLIDFGLARFFAPEEKTSTFIKGMGTAGFSPPEQFVGGGSTDPRSDLYALGATLYMLLTGKLPVMAMMRASGMQTLRPPSHYNDKVPMAVDDIVMKLMEIKPKDRFQTARAASEALSNVAPARAHRLDPLIPATPIDPHATPTERMLGPNESAPPTARE